MKSKPEEQILQKIFHFPKIDLETKYVKVFDKDFKFYTDVFFREMLAMERKRSRRSETPILLVTLNIEKLLVSHSRKEMVKLISNVLAGSRREIDIMGWHVYDRIIGIIYIGINESGKECILEKIRLNLALAFGPDSAEKIQLASEVFPVDWRSSRSHSVAS